MKMKLGGRVEWTLIQFFPNFQLFWITITRDLDFLVESSKKIRPSSLQKFLWMTASCKAYIKKVISLSFLSHGCQIPSLYKQCAPIGCYFLSVLSLTTCTKWEEILLYLLNPSPSTFAAEHTYWPDIFLVTSFKMTWCSSIKILSVGIISSPSLYHIIL